MSKFQNSFERYRNKRDLGMSPVLGYGGMFGSSTSSYLSSGYHMDKTDIVTAVYSRIALDASMVEFKHLKMSSEGIQKDMDSELIKRLTFDANIDQSGRSFIYDLVWSMLDEGNVAIVATTTTADPEETDNYEVLSMRVGKIMSWYPKHVQVECYNEDAGQRETLVCSKKTVAIVESPFAALLSKNNKTLNIIQQKSKLMAQNDEMMGSGRINGFIQVPYSTNSTRQAARATSRQAEIERQMATSKYGVVMLDHKEQYVSAGSGLNNNFLDDILKLKQDYLNNIGLTENVINGTANAEENNVYFHRVVEPCLYAIVDAVNRVFLSKTARSQGQVVKFYRDPFQLMPIESVATAADLLSRNAILYPNEVRAVIGRPPHPDPLANKLFNRNIADAHQVGGTATPGQDPGVDAYPTEEMEEFTIYSDGEGGYVDKQGNPVDEYGNPI